MYITEAATLKKGELVIMKDQNKAYKGMVFEITNTERDGNRRYLVELKQPGFNEGFNIIYDSRRLKRYEL